jgi:hypothetical protein
MVDRKISPNVKLAAIRLHEQGILRLHEILDCVGFSRRTFKGPISTLVTLSNHAVNLLIA